METRVLDGRPSPTSAFAKLAAIALILFEVGLQPFAIWHGALETSDAVSNYATVAAGREGWYVLHYGTAVCLSGIAISLVGLLAWFTASRARASSIVATLLILIGAVNMSIGFGAEAIGFYYATDTSLLAKGVASNYMHAWSDDGHYVLPVGIGVLAFYLGQAAAVGAFYRLGEFPLVLRRLLILAVVCEFVKFFVPYVPSILLEVAAASIWVALGIVAFQRLGRPRAVSHAEALLPGT